MNDCGKVRYGVAVYSELVLKNTSELCGCLQGEWEHADGHWGNYWDGCLHIGMTNVVVCAEWVDLYVNETGLEVNESRKKKETGSTNYVFTLFLCDPRVFKLFRLQFNTRLSHG